MLDIERPGVMAANNERLQMTTAACPAALELRAWLPEYRSGDRSITLDGRELPREVGVALRGPVSVLCLAPGEWLLVSDEQTASSIAARSATDVAAQGAVLVDTTDSLAMIDIRGRLARDVLSKGCGLDLRPHAFPVNRCARTRFAQIAVIIDHIDTHNDDAPSFRLYFAPSYSRYLVAWIEDAFVEFNHGTP